MHFFTWVLIVFTLLGGMAGYINPELWAGPSMLCLIFPELWPASLVAGILWYILSKDKFTAIGAGIVVLATLPTMLTACPVSFPSAPEKGEKTLKVLTYNVLCGYDLEYPKATTSRTFSYIIGSGADIVCLQEMYDLALPVQQKKATQAQLDSINRIYPHQVRNHNLELVLLSKYPIEYNSGEDHKDMQYFTYQLYTLRVDGKPLTVVNVHLSSYVLTESERDVAQDIQQDPLGMLERSAQMRATLYGKLSRAFEVRAVAAEHLASIVKTVKGPLIVCGDFNDVPGSWAYRKIRSAGLDDAYTAAGTGTMVTFNDSHLLFHIDQMLYRKDMGLRPYFVTKGKLRSSDHYPVMVSFAIEN